MVFEGWIVLEYVIIVGDYIVMVVKLVVGILYFMLKKGVEIFEFMFFDFGCEIECDGIRVVMGSYIL